MEKSSISPLVFSVSFLIIALSVSHYFVISLPNLGKSELETRSKAFEQQLLDQRKLEDGRKKCISEIRAVLKDEPDYTLEKANSIYRRCLAEQGFKPEDLVNP